MSFYLKDPHSRVDYAFEWAAGYLDGQIIADSVWLIAPAETGGIDIDTESFDLERAAAFPATSTASPTGSPCPTGG